MAHNFKLTGDYYVSIDGSDSNDGLTKDTPKRTIQAALNLNNGVATIIVGSGTYSENLYKMNGTSSLSISHTLYADGPVTIINTTNNSIVFTAAGINNVHTSSWVGFTFVNILFNPYHNTDYGGAGHYFTDCRFINSTITGTLRVDRSGGNFQFTNCIFTGCTLSYNLPAAFVAAGGTSYFNKCILINCIISSSAEVTTLYNSYVSDTIIVCDSAITGASFNYNNIQGSVLMKVATALTTGTYQDVYGRYYDLSQAGTNPSGDGSLAQPYYRAETSGKVFSYTNHRILYSSMNVNSISVDPLFNDIQAQDFTLQATSPMIGRSSDGINNIGGTKYNIRHASNGVVLDADAVSVSGLAFFGDGDYIVSGGTTGEVVSAPIQFGTSLKVVQKISYNGLLEFNKDIAGPASGNRNVPDNYTYESGVHIPPDTQGANPDRLVYELRYSTQIAEPAIDAEWDNGGYITAGNYFTMEWNTKPSFDTAFKGNGDATFNAADTPTYINATWIQLKVKLRNDY